MILLNCGLYSYTGKIQNGKFNWFSVLRPYWMDSALRHHPGLTGSQHKRSKAVYETVLQEI